MSSSATNTSTPPMKQLIEVMRNLDAQQYQKILHTLKAEHPSLAEAILEAMFTFDDLIYITDRSMQTLLKEIDRSALTRALKQSNEDVKQKILNNLSRRAAENLLEEIDLLPPVRLSEVKEAQRNISKLARSMEDAGKIVVVRPEDDDPLV